MEKCKRCEEQKGKKHPITKENSFGIECFCCGEVKPTVLDLHHTNAVLCSTDCETKYWLDILY